MTRPIGHSAKDWTQDFSHENGNYQCLCCVCTSMFYGHKRRVICFECAMKERKGEPYKCATCDTPMLCAKHETCRVGKGSA